MILKNLLSKAACDPENCAEIYIFHGESISWNQLRKGSGKNLPMSGEEYEEYYIKNCQN